MNDCCSTSHLYTINELNAVLFEVNADLSEIIECLMHSRNCFDGVETIEFEIASCESFRKGTVARMEFIGEFIIDWSEISYITFIYTIVHIVRSIQGVTSVQSMLRVFVSLTFFDWEL